ncbi:hypothetical protein BCR35DRAFT_304913 [Leucosporidium creatinivorum]|uniref:Uncharacterized protein n=1 Tax=Leucosporidium creatinivorum TaxID=106004 RepID=A0A1Y2F4R0_9BASI|nr:hypothetical protein BCR35DRAFT_304913 [Leucosporidium creatinivorum]
MPKLSPLPTIPVAQSETSGRPVGAQIDRLGARERATPSPPLSLFSVFVLCPSVLSLFGERVARARSIGRDYKWRAGCSAQVGSVEVASPSSPSSPRRSQVLKMLARTASLAIVASLAAVVFASPLPGGGDGQDIKFIEIKAIDDDKFKKTNFNVHDAAEHDANFNQVEAKDKDALKAVVFKKNDNDFGIFKRADIFANSLDLREAAGFSFDLDLKNELNLDTDLNFDRFRRVRPSPLLALSFLLTLPDLPSGRNQHRLRHRLERYQR